MHFWKNLVVCSSAGPKILAFGSHCLANFQPILDCSISNFKIKYKDSENIKADCQYSRCQLTLNQTWGFFETSGILVKISRRQVFLSLVPTCPKNCKNRGFLRYSDVWDSYDQWEHFIPEIPDGRRFLRCDRKNRNHFYFEGMPQTSQTSAIFTMSVNLAVLRIAIVVRIPVSGNRKNPRLLPFL